MLKGFNYTGRAETCNCILEVLTLNKDSRCGDVIGDRRNENSLRISTGWEVWARLNAKFQIISNCVRNIFSIKKVRLTRLGYWLVITIWSRGRCTIAPFILSKTRRASL